MVQLFAATYLRVRGVALMASIRMRKVSIPSFKLRFCEMLLLKRPSWKITRLLSLSTVSSKLQQIAIFQ